MGFFLYCDSLILPDGMKGDDNDMFWSDEWNQTATEEWCEEYFSINNLDSLGASLKYGNRQLYKVTSNIVWSQGSFDPWSGGGITIDYLSNSNSLIVLQIDKGGHHQDLMWSNANDQTSVINARKIEVENIDKWINEAYESISMGMCNNNNNNNDYSLTKSFFTVFNLVM